MTNSAIAEWSISLDATCPKCGEDHDYLYEINDPRFDPLETNTPRTKGVEVVCLNKACLHEFTLDFQF